MSVNNKNSNSSIQKDNKDDGSPPSVRDNGDDRKDERKDSLKTINSSITRTPDGSDLSAYLVYPGAERAYYDFTAERHNLNATNLFESISHLIKGSLGAGILSIHVGFMYAGLWTAIISNILIGLLMCNSMLMLVRSAHKMYYRLRIPKLTYPDLMEKAVAFGPYPPLRKYSKVMRYIVDVFLAVKMCGVCCIYQIMMATTLKSAIESITETRLDKRIWILAVTILLVLICLIRSLKYLAPFAMIADVIIALCVLTTIFYSVHKQVNIKDRPGWKSIQGFFRFNGISLFAVDGIAITMPVENSMKEPRNFRIALQYAMCVVISCTTLTGFFGYWGWGEQCASPITVHIPTGTFATVVNILLVLMLSVSFAVSLWVPFKVVWYYLRTLHDRKRSCWERLYRTVMVLIITIVSTAVPFLDDLMIFYGNFCLAFLAFIFPAMIEMLVIWKIPKKSKKRRMIIKDIIIIFFGLIISTNTGFAIGHDYKTI